MSKWLQKLRNSQTLVAAYSFGLILIASILQWSRNQVGLENLIICLVYVLVLTIICLWITEKFNSPEKQKDFDRKVEDLSNIVLNPNLNWIVNESYLRVLSFESARNIIFSPECRLPLPNQSSEYKFFQLCLNKGHCFEFFIPDRPRNRKMALDAKTYFQFEPHQLQFFFIPAHQFLFYAEVRLFHVGTYEEKGIEFLPYGDLPYFVEMDKFHSDRLIGISQLYREKFVAGIHTEAPAREEPPHG